MRSDVFFPRIVPPSAIVSGVYGLSRDRKAYRELRAAAREVLRADVPAVCLGDRLRDREPEAGSVAHGVLAAVEAMEKPNLRTLGESRARVAHSQQDGPVVALPADLHGGATGRVLHRVVEEVEKELRELVGVAAGRRKVVRPGLLETDAGVACLHVERRDDAVEQPRGRDLLAAHLLSPGPPPRDLQ